MDVYNAILNAVATVGFPIVCCAVLFWQTWKKDEQHQEEMNSLRQTVEANTQAVLELTTLIKNGGNRL